MGYVLLQALGYKPGDPLALSTIAWKIANLVVTEYLSRG